MPILHRVIPIGLVNPTNPKILISAILISFIGSLPLGTLNVITVQLAVAAGYSTALWFAAGCLLAEMIYVGISLAMMDRIVKFEILLKMLQWISLTILIGLAIASFSAAVQVGGPAKNVLIPDTLHPFFFGFFLMAANPVQIPFWFGWNTVLFARKILMSNATHYTLYIVGAGLGSLMASVLFIFGGQMVLASFPLSQKTFYCVTGGVFIFTAFLQARRILRGRRLHTELTFPR